MSAMNIYLYVKTHNKTGLKYLGKTTAKDPHKYPGSGVYWTRHLAIHGINYTTEIIKECHSIEELKKWGLYYSNLWNVVESKEWANLKEEVGDGGRQSIEVRKRISEASKGRIPWNKGKQIWSVKERKRIGEQNKLRGPQSKETIAKRVAKNTGKKRTKDQRQKAANAQKGRKLSDDHKFKLQVARQKGVAEGRIIPWNKGRKINMPSSTANYWKIISPNGTVEQILSLRKWASEHAINYQILHRNAKIGKSYKGYLAINIQKIN